MNILYGVTCGIDIFFKRNVLTFYHVTQVKTSDKFPPQYIDIMSAILNLHKMEKTYCKRGFHSYKVLPYRAVTTTSLVPYRAASTTV